jgi:hypothetical protein
MDDRVGSRAASWLLTLLLLSGCSGSDDSGIHNEAVVTRSLPGTVAVVSGGTQTVSITFNASDDHALSTLTVTSDLAALPAGWSGPRTFSCDSVHEGSGCVLNLIYAPTAAGDGTLIVNYSYKDNAGTAKIGAEQIPYTATANNNVIATAAPSGQVMALTGAGSQSVTVTFTSDDGNPATTLNLTTDLSLLPGGWHSPVNSFSCASVSSGNGCQLPLTYAPSAPDSGALTLQYTYQDNAGSAKTGSINIAYAATTHDNIAGAASPSGQITAIAGTGSQSVMMTFTTDDGKIARSLVLKSDLGSLPTGWSSTATAFTCESISSGNGCQLPLTFAPSAAGSGTLTLAYSYQDDSGMVKTGSVDINYTATTHDNVVGTASPSGQITALAGSGSQSVPVTFTTDDGLVAKSLTLTSDLSSLPSGWSSTATAFTCVSVSSGNGCQLPLTFAPSVAGSGTLTLAYSYQDNSGTTKTGSVNINYTATTHDNVVGTASPAGQITVLAGAGSRSVLVTFTTDDGLVAKSLTLTSDLSSLPSGWSSTATTFTCVSVSSGNACQLPLTFAPSVTGSGTLTLAYSYQDNSGTDRTASVALPYAGTTHNNVFGTSSPGTISVSTGGSRQAIITFTSDDGGTATGLTVTSGLSSLPAGWSTNTPNFTCMSVDAGTGCQLTLTYAPTAADSGYLTLGFNYFDNAGTSKMGLMFFAYVANAPALYVSNYNTNYISICSINSNGTIGSCRKSPNDFPKTYDMTLTGGVLSMTSTDGPNVSLLSCTPDTDGSITLCAGTTELVTHATNISVNPVMAHSYIYDGTGMLSCSISYSTALSAYFFGACGAFTAPNGLQKVAFSPDGTLAYGAYTTSDASPTHGIDVCSVAVNGTFSNCKDTGTNTSNSALVERIAGSRLYALNAAGGLDVCPINVDGTLGTCQNTASSEHPLGVDFTSSYAYLSTSGSTLRQCVLNVDGTLGTCIDIADASFNGTTGIAVR